MRPPRLLLLVFCFIFFPIFLTFFSALTSSPRVATPSTFAGRASGLHALFSFNIPSSLFPPSAVISLTDDNSTFFLARPAAFGPLLPDKGLSGQLWVGSGFGERTAAGAEGELGCSDIPGWGEGDSHRQDKNAGIADVSGGKSVPALGIDSTAGLPAHHRLDSQPDAGSQHNPADPSSNDGTDDHLHHPLLESEVVDLGAPEQHGEPSQNKQTAHADIQSLQESAEINGKVVLLSRGGCGFLEKVKWAQRRGGIALIVGDDTRGGSLVTMYARGDTSNVTIPALFTSHTTAQLLSSLVPSQAEDSNTDESSNAGHTKLSSHTSKQRVESTATTTAASSPTSTRNADAATSTASALVEPKTGLFRGLLSLLGLGNNGGYPWSLPEDSRRPPSSGNINWILMDHWDEQEPSSKARTKVGSTAQDRSQPQTGDGDGFVIGVQDWRDPDLVAPMSSSIPSSTSASESDGSRSTPGPLKGGSITPGSGEYRTIDKSKVNKDLDSENSDSRHLADHHTQELSTPNAGWFAKHLGWSKDAGGDTGLLPKQNHQEPQKSTDGSSQNGVKAMEHDGLWVTMTPTSMSTSPFFDTLLVLVVSPLLTLTVVYALLLIRSRIRRRRWRAPKSLVDRLPVRTYHTISTNSSSSASSLRSSSPGEISPTSPLLGSRSYSGLAGFGSRSQKGTLSPGRPRTPSKKECKKEKPGSSTLWRRKYTGRQVECVVCLEEYVDGQSRVMSLPCGHEFHAECITPWLTTRRRTCPICKGDVVRSLSQNKPDTCDSTDPTTRPGHSHELGTRHSFSSAPVPIAGISEDEMSDPERHANSDDGLLEGQSSSAPPPTWRNFAALSFSALSGDTIWHQGRTDDR
ncbi:hypothetical protein FE257_012028 [Aspergillus nanangensis]|uniref:RING-type E3 ubiquitin transferase n=1 Tax=Aspergillus nanangensis TaxID=2582783 RepID=A0AAD4GS72_ASPNN|nr:hypothetical protein FE257_012028 [Aspergillus nanangensis]